MALPKIKHPTYAITIPSTKQQITIRPFTVQEEKLLLMAKASEKLEDVIDCMVKIVQNCIIEPIDASKLATFDIEYIFIKLRSKSVGEMVDLEYNDPETGKVSFQVNLEEVDVKYVPEHTSKIKVFDDIFIKMKYPTLEDMKSVGGDINENNIIDILYKCIEQMFDDQEVYTEYTKEELEDFINNLPVDSIANITNFFNTMPAVEHKVILKNKQGETKEVLLRGINSFFTF
jgi:hypothetical protein